MKYTLSTKLQKKHCLYGMKFTTYICHSIAAVMVPNFLTVFGLLLLNLIVGVLNSRFKYHIKGKLLVLNAGTMFDLFKIFIIKCLINQYQRPTILRYRFNATSHLLVLHWRVNS